MHACCLKNCFNIVLYCISRCVLLLYTMAMRQYEQNAVHYVLNTDLHARWKHVDSIFTARHIILVNNSHKLQ